MVPAVSVSVTPAGTVTSPVTATVPLQVSSLPSAPEVVGRLVSMVTPFPALAVSITPSVVITRDRIRYVPSPAGTVQS